MLQDQISHIHTSGDSSSEPLPSELARLCCEDEVKSLLSCILQQVRGKDSSPAHHGFEGKRAHKRFLLCQCHHKRQGWLSHTHTLGVGLSVTLTNWVSFSVLTR